MPNRQAGMQGSRRILMMNGTSPFPVFLSTLALTLVAASPSAALEQDHHLDYSAAIGGSDEDQIRDVEADENGNVYLVGGSPSANYPTKPNAEGFVFDDTPGGSFDAVVSKLDRDGKLVWSTLIGSPGYDRIYASEIGRDGNLYVAGRGGDGLPVTQGALQTVFQGGRANPNDPYFEQDGFVCKLDPEGHVLACTYFGGDDGGFIRDLAVSPTGEVYVTGPYLQGIYPEVIASTLLNVPLGGDDVFVAKLSSDLSTLEWTVLLGGSDKEFGESSIDVDATGNVYVMFATHSSGIATPGAFDEIYSGLGDLAVAKIDPGGGMQWCTYVGGSDGEFTETHELSVDDAGNSYAAFHTVSPQGSFTLSPGTIVHRHGSTPAGSTIAAFKLAPDGSTLEALAFIGGDDTDVAEGTKVTPAGEVFFTGETSSSDFPTTTGGLSLVGGQSETFVMKLDNQLDLLYSGLVGGSERDIGRASTVDRFGAMYAAGLTQSSDWPGTHLLGSATGGPNDGFVFKISPGLQCADADGDQSITATDALRILLAGVGAFPCAACICDADDSGAINASDALLALLIALSARPPGVCPSCP